MFSQRLSPSVFLLAVAGLSAAQDFSSFGLSQQCQDVLSSTILQTSEISKCLNTVSILNLLTISSDTSIIPPVTNWLQGVCAAQPCSDDALRQAATNITTGCQSDLNTYGITQDKFQTIIDAIVQYYPTAREVACLQDNKASNDPLCATELATDAEGIFGILSTSNIISTYRDVVNGDKSFTIPQNVTCNSCTQAAWAIIRGDIPSLASNTDVTDPIQSQCGADFLTATQPSEIGISNGSSGDNGAAASLQINVRSIAFAAVPLVGFLAGGAILL